MVLHPADKKETGEAPTKAISTPLVLATHNPGKVKEFAHLLLDIWPGEVVATTAPSPTELTHADGGTFAGNATLKAEASIAYTEDWILADDSGLCVDALGGAPGVDSAHLGGWPVLLGNMRSVELREATFVCVLALARKGQKTRIFRGETRGRIATAAQGEHGFGFDPVFIPEDGDGRTFGQMSGPEKARFSHRGRAVNVFKEWLKSDDFTP
jgi:XTP/dITP diphosphohydrolase